MTRPVFASCVTFLLFLEAFCSGSETDVEVVYGDEGSNLTLPCKRNNGSPLDKPMWRWSNQGKNDMSGERTTVTKDDSLIFMGLSRDEADVYTCADDNGIINRVQVIVRTPPPPLANVTVVPSTILAFIHWEVADTGGYPITHFTAHYRLKHPPPDQLPEWQAVLPDKISPTATQIDVYQLEPNSTYVFQVWANNRLGRGEITEVEALTKHDSQEIELAKHLLEGAETFDTRVWVAAVAIVMGTLLVLATATIYALYRECRIPLTTISDNKDVETMELIPNIIMNPGYQDFAQSEWSEPDENSNDTVAIRLNNNTVINPVRI
ncbi:FN3 [Nesidiocoris tenuis]|uniref:FN3 n=1 Tax=Nesidiocoris tenuis TaxID=355587 RepID=A0ABN7AUC4_9HEMI|nr:FN3 [Nesidiocoris tenuis]